MIAETVIDPPRYKESYLPAEERSGPIAWGVFDTFTQTFVFGERFVEKVSAVRRAVVMNGAYARAMRKQDK